MKIQDTVAFVTGGAQGIGRAICEALLQKGAKVVIADVNEAQGKLTTSELDSKYAGHVIFTVCDVTNDDSVKRALAATREAFGRPSIIANNAGILDENLRQQTIAINLGGMIRVAYSAMEHMRADNGGSGGVIVNTASIAGLIDFGSFPVYCASKFGAVGFTRSFAATPNFDEHKVRMNCLCPCLVDTDIVRCLNDEGAKEGKIVTYEPLQDYGNQEKIPTSVVAGAFIQLVEDDSRNGQSLIVPNDGPPRYADYPSYL